MDISIEGNKPLKGSIIAHGNKNAILPIIAGAVLVNKTVILRNVPYISDVATFIDFLQSINFNVEYAPNLQMLVLQPSNLQDIRINHTALNKMRASLLLITALALKYKQVVFEGTIGGCSLGYRPLDTFIANLKELGLKVEYTDKHIVITSGHIRKDTSEKFIWQPETSVTSTEAAMLVASVRPGKTIIYNAASEPHVQDLSYFLRKTGVKISGIGTNFLEITGDIPTNNDLYSKQNKNTNSNLHRPTSNREKPISKLSSNPLGTLDTHSINMETTNTIEHTISSDHHEIVTYLGLSALTKGSIDIYHNLEPKQFLTSISQNLATLGINITTTRVTKKHLKQTEFINVTEDINQPRKAEKSHPMSNSQQNAIQNSKKETNDQQTLTVTSTNLYNTARYLTRIDSADFKIKTSLTTPRITTIKPHPWPGFPVDLLPILIPIAIKGDKPVLFHNWMYEAGLSWTNELKKANVRLTIADPHRVIIYPGSVLKPASFDAPYIIRATIALAMLALHIPGQSTIRNADALKRAHPNFLENLQKLGGRISVVE